MNCLFLWLFDDWVLNQLSIEIPSELQLPKAFSWASFWKNESLSNGVKNFSKYLEKSSKPDILHSDYTATSFKVNDSSVHERHTDHNQEIKTSTLTETSYKNTCCARYEKPGTKNHPKLWPKNMWNLWAPGGNSSSTRPRGKGTNERYRK